MKRWLYVLALVVGLSLLWAVGCSKRFSYTIVVGNRLQNYLPAEGGTVVWEFYGPGGPLQISWPFSNPCLPPSMSVSTTAEGSTVSCNVPKTAFKNNAFAYQIGPPLGSNALRIGADNHILRIGPCDNCGQMDALHHFPPPLKGLDDENVMGCQTANTPPAVLPPTIQTTKSSTVNWTVVGTNNPKATLDFGQHSPCSGGVLSETNTPVCVVARDASGDYDYTVPMLTGCASGSATQFKLHVN
jgi:hypothetical protein